MRGIFGAVFVAGAALLVCCSADSHRENELSGEGSGKSYDVNEYKQAAEFEEFLRFLEEYDRFQDRNGLHGIGGSLVGRNLNGIGGSSLLGRSLAGNRNLNGIGGSSLVGRNLNGIGGSSLVGRNLNGIGGSSLVGRNLNGIGGSSLVGRNLNGIGGSSLVGRNLNGIGGSSLVGREVESEKYARFVDSLGGSNFVRNLDSIGGGNFVRNLDSIGGGNFVKKNLDQLGGPNLVKKNLDSLGGGNFVRNLDSLGGGNFVYDDASGHKNRILHPIFEATGGNNPRSSYGGLLKMLDYISRVKDAGKYPMSPYESSLYGGLNDDFTKRNFDEIDRSNLDTFVSKRNMDEIDRSNMPFPYAIKRFYHLYGSNYLDLDTPVSSFDKKRYRPDYPMDEIDLSHFPIGSKRSLTSFPLARNLQ